MSRTHTHTVAELAISGSAYDEIRKLLKAAGYQHAFDAEGMIDMTGIGVTRGEMQPDHALLTVESICGALRESAKPDAFCFGRIQEEDEDEEFNQTGRAFTLIDGWVDLERVAEILNGKEPQA